MKKKMTKTQIQENIKKNAQKRANKRAYFIKMNNRIPKKKENTPLFEPFSTKTQTFLTKKEQKTINKAIAKKLSAKKLHYGERKTLLIDYKIEKWKKLHPAPCSKDDMFKDEFNYKDWETKLNTFIVNIKNTFGINIKNKIVDIKPTKKAATVLLVTGEYDNITIDENGNRHFSIVSKDICTIEDEDNVVDITTAKTSTRLNDLAEAILGAEFKKPKTTIDSVTLSKQDGTEIFTISPYMWENGQIVRSIDWINKKWEANNNKQKLATAA